MQVHAAVFSSAVQAIMTIAGEIRMGAIDIGIGAGVESMSERPMNTIQPKVPSCSPTGACVPMNTLCLLARMQRPGCLVVCACFAHLYVPFLPFFVFCRFPGVLEPAEPAHVYERGCGQLPHAHGHHVRERCTKVWHLPPGPGRVGRALPEPRRGRPGPRLLRARDHSWLMQGACMDRMVRYAGASLTQSRAWADECRIPKYKCRPSLQ